MTTENTDNFDPTSSEFPENIDDLVTAVEARALKEQGGSEPEQTEPKPTENKEEKTEAEEKVAEASDSAAPGAKDEADGVLLKDGKRVLPYGVLAGARKQAQEARERAEQAEAKAKELAEQLEALKANKEQSAKAQAKEDAIRAKIDELKEAVPEVGEVLDEIVGRFDSEVKALKEAKAQPAETVGREKPEGDPVQEAIDENEKLRFLQVEKPVLWNRAAEIDAELRAQPEWTGKPLGERFEAVVKRLEEETMPITVPEKYRATKPEQKQQQSGGKKDAKEKGSTREVPTLTDLPGGVPPDDVGRQLETMTPSEREAFIERQLDKGMDIQELIRVYG